MNPIRQINAFLKLAGLELRSLKRQKSMGKTTRYYGFDPQRFEIMRSLAVNYKSEEDFKEERQESMAA